MPITKSVKKRLRQNKKREKRNKSRQQSYKERGKKIKNLIHDNKKQEAQQLLPDYYKAVDKAAKVKAISKNKAARKKSQISKLVNQA